MCLLKLLRRWGLPNAKLSVIAYSVIISRVLYALPAWGGFLSVEPVNIINYNNKNWLQFIFIVKADVLKQQISKFYPQILSTEDSFYIYFSQRPFINVKAIFCA